MRNSAPYRAKRIVEKRTMPYKAVKIGVGHAGTDELMIAMCQVRDDRVAPI